LRKLLGGPGGPDVADRFLPRVASKEWPSDPPGRPGC
ncbi:trimeric intracellular cation channel family protein, partial [Nocardia cyriacigeorgica]